jgi:glycosyltransferase involved in cell wall biosynthesis
LLTFGTVLDPSKRQGQGVPSGRKRILHIQRVKGIGGSERHLLGLLPALQRAGLDVRMCVLRSGRGDIFVDDMRQRGVDVVVHEAGPDLNPLLLPSLVSDIRSFHPHIVHTHLVHADLHGQTAALMARVPAVSSVHAAPDFYRREPYRSAGRAVGRIAKRRIAISEHVARFVCDQGLAPPDRIRTIHYGMDASGFRRTDAERDRARAALGLAPETVAIGIASRLIPGKGHDVLIDAFAKAAAENPRLRLLVVGEGPERAAAEAQAARQLPAGTFEFLGFVHEIADFMSACDAIAFPTQPEFGEGFGLAALEAMAAGRPVISSDMGPLPEIIVDEVTGFVIPARSRDGFARAIARVGADADLRRRVGEAAAQRAHDTFSLDAMVEKTIGVYSELL